jgi:mono/diheme cytochrome c family protein
MAALHMAGGVPAGWRFTVPPGDPAAGRRDFVDLGCDSCHAVGGDLPGKGGVGPDLGGMGSHHPPEYFAESIVNPDAVLVEGTGYLGPDGRSVMPAYPDLTLVQLADLVAYVSSLTDGGGMHVHPTPSPGVVLRSSPIPLPPPNRAGVFLVQAYPVSDGQLEAFERWWAEEGAAAFLATDGVVSVDTYVDRTRPGTPVATVFGFRDLMALNRFSSDRASQELGDKFDSFVGPHDHQLFSVAPVYRVDALSTPPVSGRSSPGAK